MKISVHVAIIFAAVFAFSGAAHTAQAEKRKPRQNKFEHFAFQTIEVPRSDGVARFTTLQGINDRGQIVGGFTTSDTEAFVINKKGKITRIGCPEAIFTLLQGINNSGSTVGTCHPLSGGSRAFLRHRSGDFTFIHVPEATESSGQAINDRNQVLGHYRDQSGNFHSFVWDDGTISNLDLPETENIQFASLGINNRGQIVGFYFERSCGCNERGFLWNDGLITTIDFPEAIATLVTGINDNGQIVGFFVDAGEKHHGFVYDRGEYFPIDVDVPGIEFTEAHGINNRGIIVGRYLREDPNSAEDPIHDFGFIASPSRTK